MDDQRASLIAHLRSAISDIEGKQADIPESACFSLAHSSRMTQREKKTLQSNDIREAHNRYASASPHRSGTELLGEAEAYAKIVRSVSVCEQSSEKLRKKLVRAGFSNNVIDRALQKAQHLGIVDDTRYSDMLIRSTLSQGKGLQFVLSEIESLGIDPASLPSYVDYLAEDESYDRDRAYSFLETHPPRSKNKREGAYRKLISKGFSSSIAASVARIWSESQSSL